MEQLTQFLVICNAITVIGGAVAVISTWKKHMDSPRKQQDKKIENIEGRIVNIEESISDINKKLDSDYKSIRNTISLPHWLEKLTGFSSVGFNVGYWSAPMVPYLAQGAVIPPNKEFMAVLGDQKSGNNIEAPESLIRRIVREESGNGKGSTYNVTAQVNRRTLFDLVLEEGKVRRTVTGRNPFETV